MKSQKSTIEYSYKDDLGFTHHIRDEHVSGDKRRVTRVTTADAAVVMESAHAERMLGNNGFSKGRNQRVIGEIPLDQFVTMQAEAEMHGEELTGSMLKRFLNDHPEYRTVNQIDSGGLGHAAQIIIK